MLFPEKRFFFGSGIGVCSFGNVALEGLGWWVLPEEGKGGGTGIPALGSSCRGNFS